MPTKKTEETLYLELDGRINLVTRKGRKTTREELDGKVCLECVLHVLKLGLAAYEDDGK